MYFLNLDLNLKRLEVVQYIVDAIREFSKHSKQTIEFSLNCPSQYQWIVFNDYLLRINFDIPYQLCINTIVKSQKR